VPTSPLEPRVPVRWPFVGRAEELDVVARALGDQSCEGVCVFGGAGVGKTRLAEECLDAAQLAGHAVGRATATMSARQVPLGAFAHLLAYGQVESGRDVVARFAAVVASVRERAGARRFVLFVDDLPLLDETSAVLVQSLLDAGDTFLLATARSEHALGVGLPELARGDRVRRIDLERLDRGEFEVMLVGALGGEIVPATLSALWSVSLGNALFAREIVMAAQAQGALRVRHGVWRVHGRVPVVGRLADVIAVRLGQLDAAERPVAELLAVAAPVELAELEDRFGPTTTEALERDGVLRVVADGSRPRAELAHPLYGELLRDAMASMTRRRILADHLDWLESVDGGGDRDPVRLAIWKLEVGRSADVELLLAVARTARYAHDYRNVERLTRAALAQQPSTTARLMLGQALADLGRFEEAEVVLAEAQREATDDTELFHALISRLRNFVWGLLRPLDAERLARAALDEATDDMRDALRAALAWVLVFSDQPAAALAELDERGAVEVRRGGELRTIAETCALIANGQAERAAMVARGGRDLRIATSADVDRPGTHLATEVFALLECGRLAEAFEIGEAGYEVARQQRHPIGQILFTMNLGRAALLAGAPRRAKRWLAECDALCTKFGFDGPRRIVLSGLATANSWLGEVDLARRAADEAAGLAPFGFMSAEQDRGGAWAAVAENEAEVGRAILSSAVAQAARVGDRSCEALLLHDLVRLGRAADVADRLSEVARLGDTRLVAAYAAHARAAAAEDPVGLVEASDTLEAIGAALAAAEAATAAAQAWLSLGESRRAAGAQARAATLLLRCEGARTPGLETSEVSVALTKREREIVELAAAGASSSAIAGHLFLSVRTVNNHLQRAYVKLGVTSRNELRAALVRDGA
jgi:DNA-binding CsgD family transcriptional regulator/tetratricopeptide (TPR) repeat protein